MVVGYIKPLMSFGAGIPLDQRLGGIHMPKLPSEILWCYPTIMGSCFYITSMILKKDYTRWTNTTISNSIYSIENGIFVVLHFHFFFCGASKRSLYHIVLKPCDIYSNITWVTQPQSTVLFGTIWDIKRRTLDYGINEQYPTRLGCRGILIIGLPLLWVLVIWLHTANDTNLKWMHYSKHNTRQTRDHTGCYIYAILSSQGWYHQSSSLLIFYSGHRPTSINTGGSMPSIMELYKFEMLFDLWTMISDSYKY